MSPFDLVGYVHARHYLTDDRVLARERAAAFIADEELGAAGIRVLRAGHADRPASEQLLGELSRKVR